MTDSNLLNEPQQPSDEKAWRVVQGVVEYPDGEYEVTHVLNLERWGKLVDKARARHDLKTSLLGGAIVIEVKKI